MTSSEIIKSSEESKIIILQRNGDKQITKIKVYRTLLSHLKKQFSREHDWASILALYDLKTGHFWWQYTGERNDNFYFKRDIDTCLSQLGYWEEESGIYIYYDSNRDFRKFFYLSESGMVQFHIKWEILYITRVKEQHNLFEQACQKMILKIKEDLNQEKTVNDELKIISLPAYIDNRFFHIPNFCGIAEVGDVISVKRQDDKWLVELAGVNWEEDEKLTKSLYVKDWLVEWRKGYRRTKVTLILNENYEMIDILGEDFVKKSF